MNKEIPKHLWHHGTCDCCLKKFKLVFHFNYYKQLDKKAKHFRVCESCLPGGN